jgi:predicted MFS family arabinose efflux permease
MNLPLLVSLIVLFSFKNPISSYFFLGLLGISNGLANVLGSSTWAEIYGVRHIGEIRALTAAMMVFSTAFGTAIFGFFIDNGLSIEKIGIGCSLYVITSIILIFLFRNTFEPRVIKT